MPNKRGNRNAKVLSKSSLSSIWIAASDLPDGVLGSSSHQDSLTWVANRPIFYVPTTQVFSHGFIRRSVDATNNFNRRKRRKQSRCPIVGAKSSNAISVFSVAFCSKSVPREKFARLTEISPVSSTTVAHMKSA